MNKEYIQSLIEVVSAIEVKSETEQTAKMELIETVENLQKENQQLKKQLQLKKQELNGFVATIAKYLEFEEPEYTIYDEIIGKIVELKYNKEQLKQRDEVIEEAIEYCNEYKDYLKYKYMTNLYNAHLLDILNKYKGDNNE